MHLKTRPIASKLNLIVGCLWVVGAGLHGATGLNDWHAAHSPIMSKADAADRLKHFWWELPLTATYGGLAAAYLTVGALQGKKRFYTGDDEKCRK